MQSTPMNNEKEVLSGIFLIFSCFIIKNQRNGSEDGDDNVPKISCAFINATKLALPFKKKNTTTLAAFFEASATKQKPFWITFSSVYQ